LAYDKDPSFVKGLLISFLIMLTSLIVALIPLIGAVLALTMIPYLAGALGSRFAHPKERVPLTLTCSMTWSILETGLLIGGLYVITRETPMGLVIDSLSIWIIAMLWLSNMIFMLLGSFHPWRDPFTDLK
jgi:hypothetical protein